MNRYSLTLLPLLPVLGVLATAPSCSSSDPDDGGFTSGTTGTSGSTSTAKGGSTTTTGNGGATSTGLGGTTSTAKGGTVGTSGSTSTTTSGGRVATGAACPGVPAADPNVDGQCGGIQTEAEAAAIDMFIMMDRSCSMNYCLGGNGESCASKPDCSAAGGSRWDTVRKGLVDFVAKVGNKDVRAGIGFFPNPGTGDDADCNINLYQQPAVAIGPMATAGPAIIAAIDATTPAAFTPTSAALDGALRYAKSWATQNPGRQTVVVLVTDGYPTQCDTSIANIGTIAKTNYEGSPRVRTYAVGLGAGFNLDSIALAGGTNAAFNFDKNAVTSDALVTTLMNITASKVVCSYEIPPVSANEVFNPNKVQVIYTPAVGAPQEVPKIAGAAACDRNPNGGWYYTDPANPKQIDVCPCTCSNFGAGNVSIAIGCDPYLGIK
ncbi:MAG: vWA domain-containing protein [Polyangiaceae bacterium]